MNRSVVLLAAALFAASCGPSGPVQAKLDAPGTAAPDFTMTDLEGNDVTLTDLAGSVVVLNFWDTG